MSDLLEVRDLRTVFVSDDGEVPAVNRISFRVGEGEIVGLVGESGCGKTVTALSIMGLLPRPAGRIAPGSSIRWRGRELVGEGGRALRRVRGREISMIFQEPATSLSPVHTVGEQILEPLRRHRKLRGREGRAEVVRLLREVGIPDPEERFHAHPHQLSGGMRQRIMIAIALSCDPGLLVADEPTTALDVTIQAQILDLLAELARRRGMAVLLITHDLGVVAEVCDRVLVMYGGRIVESAGVRELFRDPRHPYTLGLLASLPAGVDAAGALVPIPGAVPEPGELPDGCGFRDRCPSAHERCRVEPPFFRVGDAEPARRSRCWLEDDGGTG